MPRFLVVQHSTPEFLGLFEQAFEDRGIAFSYVRPFAGDALPAMAGAYDALWLLGGPGVPGNPGGTPWLAEELRLIGSFRRAQRPVVGLGLGALLAVQACGGRFGSDVSPHVGWTNVRVTTAGTNDLLADAIASERVLSLHAGHVELPAGVAALACAADDGRWLLARPEPLVYALLFRPEMKPAMLEDIVMEGDRELPDEFATVLEEAKARWEDQQRIASRVIVALVRALDLMTERPKRPVIPIRAVGSDG